MRECSLGHVEVTVDICFERSIPLLLSDVFEICLMLLKGSVIHKNVELAKLLHRPGDQFSTDSGICNIADHGERLSTFSLNRTLSFLCVSLLWLKVSEGHISTLARK